VSKTHKIQWYPNPVKIGDKLKMKTELESPDDIRLIDLYGKEICKLNLDKNDNSVILPLGLKSGVYIIECKTLNTVLYNKLILNN
jgi:hypothetical protein